MKRMLQRPSTWLLVLMVILTTMKSVSAQTAAWANGMGGILTDWSLSSAVDASGNVFTTGYFENTADLDPGAATFNVTTAGDDDIFITKVDAAGNFLWGKKFGSAGRERGIAVVTDAAGNVYCVGNFVNTIDFDPGAGVVNVAAGQYGATFVVKLDAGGNFVWVKSVAASVAETGPPIAIDASANVYVTGTYSGTIDFDPNPAVTSNLTSHASSAFIWKLNSSGNLVWAKGLNNTSHSYGQGIGVDNSGNVVISGFMSNTIDFDPGPGVFSLTAEADIDPFALKLDASGNFVWAKLFPGSEAAVPWGMTVDGPGNTYLTGVFRETMDVDPGPNTYLLTAQHEDSFIIKLTPAGDLAWGTRLGSASVDNGQSIAVSTAGNVYTIGEFHDVVDFDPGAGVFNMTTLNTDIYVLILNSAGEFINAVQLGGPANDYARSIRLDAFNNIYTSGVFYQTADFDPGAGTISLSSFGGWDGFTQKMYSGIAPQSVVLVPINNAINQYASLNVTVQEVPGATSYTIELNTLPTFDGTSIVSTGGTIQNFTGLAYSTQYYTRVKTNLSGLWGSSTTFTTGPVPPAVLPYVSTPTNAATGVVRNPTIVSTSISGASTYTIELNTASDFTGTSYVSTGGVSQKFTNLSFSTTFYSRVKTNLSPYWGATKSFTTASAQAQSYIVTPVDNATNVNNNIALVANNIGATTYTIQISPVSNFLSGVISQTGNTPTLNFTGLAYNTRYYARVSTNFDANWGPLRSFTTYYPPDYAYITSPANGAINVGLQVGVTCNPVPNAGYYTIELMPVDPVTLVQNGPIISNTSTTPGMGFYLNPGVKYQARVRTNLVPVWGPLRYFTTGTLVALTYVSSPLPGSQNVSTSPSVTANQVGQALNYKIELNTSSSFNGTSFVKTGTGGTRTFTFTGLSAGTTYFSRVTHSLMPAGTWGETKSFRTSSISIGRVAQSDEPETIEEIIESDRFAIYPNPANHSITIQLPEETDRELPFSIIDLQGQEMVSHHIEQGKREQDVSTASFKDGFYIMNINLGDAVIRKKFLVLHK